MATAAAAEDVAMAADSLASGRRRGQRKLSGWGTVFCFGCGSRRERGEEALAEEGTTTTWQRWARRRKRTVPVDGDLVPGTADRDAMRRGAGDREPRCCFLAPARAPGRKYNALDSGSGSGSSSSHDNQRRLEHTEQRPPPRSPSEAAAPSSQSQATHDSRSRRAERSRGAEPRARARTGPSDSEGLGRGEASARGPCPKASAGAGAFGPVMGLSVVAAVSVAGLLGGRVWAVACACAWLAALSGLLRRREARATGSGAGGSDGGEVAVADVDSKEYKKLVVLRGLLDRDRAKAVKA